MLIAWTTLENRADAEAIASGAVAAKLAACVQIDGPIESHYRWQGKLEKTTEFRLCFKFAEAREAELESFVFKRHPARIPEWVVVRAARVAEKYLSWAEANSKP